MRNEILVGPCLETLAGLENESVNCCVTSPPYWGTRDYGHPDQFGLEPTPERYVEKLVAQLREVRRVLRSDGTLWLNLGDSYAGSGKGEQGDGGQRAGRQTHSAATGPCEVPPSLKRKDLVGIPWRAAFALQADGWYLRSDIVWHKPNPVPESVTDRPTKAHEYVFLFAKSERYFYDAWAIKEPHQMRPQRRPGGRPTDRTPRPGQPRQAWSTAAREDTGVDGPPDGRNKRSVWRIHTRPFPEAHFAVMPEKLAELCVLAGSPVHCCVRCKAPWVRRPHPETHRFEPTCACEGTVNQTEPSLVLDPFFGAGTVGLVARQHGRDYLGCELNPAYAELARARIERGTAQAQLFTPTGDVAGERAGELA